MKVNLTHNDQSIQKALLILFNQLETAKFLDIISTLNLGSQGDYVKLKDELFKNDTIDSIYEEMRRLRKLCPILLFPELNICTFKITVLCMT